jgi:hypothetical protein
MRTIFSRFERYTDADEAVRALLANGIAKEAINVLVDASIAKSNMDEVNLARVHVDVTDAVGKQELTGLALLVGNEQPVNIPGVGPLLAAGQLATILASAAVPSDRASDDLQTLLERFGVPVETAIHYCTAVAGTGVLVWVRTEDERIGEVGEVFRRYHGKEIISNRQ